MVGLMMDKNELNREIFDTEPIYCRKLGHFLKFNYCRSERNGLPCARTIKCWTGKIPVSDYLEQNFNQSEIQYLFEPVIPKMTSIIELIQRAQALKD
jgi:hypothetical protein